MNLGRITQMSMGTELNAITTSTDPAEQAREIVNYASRYNLIRELSAIILTFGADKPVLQNVLLDDNMTLEDGRAGQATALDLVRLEGKVERLGDRVNELAGLVGNLTHTMQRRDQAPVAVGWKTVTIIFVALAAVVVAQITVLAWVGALPRG